MVHSMTAYARQEAGGSWGSVLWEIRTVNCRYLECHFRLPDSLRLLETDLREMVRSRLFRGKVDCYCHFLLGADNDSTIILNEPLAKALIRVSEEVNHWLPVSNGINSMSILQWPGVIQDKGTLSSEILDVVRKTFSHGLEQLVSGRECEGQALNNKLIERLSKIKEKTSLLAVVQSELQLKQRERLKQRLEALKVEVESERFEQEVVLLLQRLDIAEEIDRLNVHCVAFSEALHKGGPIGRRLDFLLQEMNREVNTMGSKTNEMTVTKEVVELKVLIEQIREQVQNIE